MDPVLFYGNHAASSFGAIVALEWLGRPYHLTRLNLPFDARSETFTRINPVQKVPTLLRENGAPLSESLAILQYLADRDPDRTLTYPPGTAERDHLNQVLAFLHTDFWSSFAPAFEAFDMDLTGKQDPPAQSMLRRLGRKNVAKAHADLERMMGGHAWLAGDKRTIADAYFVGIARWAPFLAQTGAEMIDPRAYPRLLRHYEQLETDPAVIFAHAIEDEQPAISAGGFRGHLSLEAAYARVSAARA